jgi:hypothetical protein
LASDFGCSLLGKNTKRIKMTKLGKTKIAYGFRFLHSLQFSSVVKTAASETIKGFFSNNIKIIIQEGG